MSQQPIPHFQGLWSQSSCPFKALFQIKKVWDCPKSRPVLLTIITLKSDSRFRRTDDFCGRLYRSVVLMRSSGAVANGVVSGVRGKRPRWDYHSHGGLRKVLPAQALRVWATHFRGQGKLSNEQPRPFASFALRVIPPHCYKDTSKSKKRSFFFIFVR